MKWLLGIVGALIVGVGLIFANITAPLQPIDEGRMLARINGVRYDKGLEPLRYDATLERGAQQRAERLCNAPFTHDNYLPELAESHYNYAYAGENLAQGNWKTDEFVQAWIDSETHYANIIKPEYRETGIGIADCGRQYVIVQWFGTEK